MKNSTPHAKGATDIAYLAEFMHGIRTDQNRLREIQTVYDNLTLLGQLLCAGTDITQMRNDFKELADELLEQLAQELRKKAILTLRSDARIAIDILIRNLFERTADIGFLATDSEICAFAEAAARDPAGIAQRTPALRARLAEYVRKYSVYHNIILLSPEGRLLAQLDENNPLQASHDPLIAETLATEAAYVESFRPTDLLPQQKSPLIYSYRVMSADGERPVAVLCLCFRFQDECARIFRSLLAEDDWRIITILDAQGEIIASSDPYQFPLGARLERSPDEACRIARFAGREYLATTCHTHGYQGYAGPGWIGHALVPLNHAFEVSLAQELQDVPAAVREGVLETATLFSPKLRDIPLRAASIQHELNRAVWNGNVWLSRDTYALNTSFAKVLLWEIGSTGMKTRSVFSESTTNLYETVVSSVLSDCTAQAALAMDIMDRNLYERANDCRWWAMTTAFRTDLAALDDEGRRRLTGILRTINHLYTVYSNLVLFDHRGQVVAVSNPAYNDMLGRPLQMDWVRQTLALPNSQSYCVSEFAPTPLYMERSTYIYAAAVRAAEADEPLGGIAVVFDAAPQFIAMLEDALPRKEDGSIVDGAFAVYAEKDGSVIASTDPALKLGAKLPLGQEFFALERGRQYANIIEYEGRYFSVGSRMSAGYREYKGEDDRYRNDVIALVFVPLSERVADAATARSVAPAAAANYSRRLSSGSEDTLEIATFYIGGSWYGIRSSHVVEAIDTGAITTIPGAPEWARGCVMHNDQAITIVDLALMLSGKEAARETAQIVLVRVPKQNASIGILVDELGEIPEIAVSRIEAVPPLLASGRTLSESLVKPLPGDADQRILVILSAERILARLANGGLGEVPLLEARHDVANGESVNGSMNYPQSRAA